MANFSGYGVLLHLHILELEFFVKDSKLLYFKKLELSKGTKKIELWEHYLVFII